MKTLIFLDDERNLEDVTWINYGKNFDTIVVVRNYEDFCDTVNGFLNPVDFENIVITFDHDLADFGTFGEKTGMDCAHYLVNTMINHNLNPNDLEWYVHSQNPVGKKSIESLILNYIDFYNKESLN